MYDDALKDCNKGIEVKPEVGDLYMLRARCYAQKGNKAQAMQDVQKGQSLGAKVDAALAQLIK
jgi:Flp pilus assembly protein TadD